LGAAAPHRAMQAREFLGRHRVGPLEQRERARVGRRHFTLLRIRHGENAQRQDFVDFRAVKEVARTFRRDFRVIIKDDGSSLFQMGELASTSPAMR
jgi:hypothetical protein